MRDSPPSYESPRPNLFKLKILSTLIKFSKYQIHEFFTLFDAFITSNSSEPITAINEPSITTSIPLIFRFEIVFLSIELSLHEY